MLSPNYFINVHSIFYAELLAADHTKHPHASTQVADEKKQITASSAIYPDVQSLMTLTVTIRSRQYTHPEGSAA
jgi:hypothetical protein